MRSLLLISALALGISISASARPAEAAVVHMFVRHTVADYASWRKTYDEFGPTRTKMGVIAAAVYQATDNPNDITVTHDFKTVEKAKAFSESVELKAAMEKAGVVGAPTIWFTTRAAGMMAAKPKAKAALSAAGK